MKNLEKFWSYVASTQTLAFTMVMRRRFAQWGVRSRIESPAKLVSPYLIYVGNNVYICEHAWLNAKDHRGDGSPTLHIGDGTYIGRCSQINAWQDVHIGQNVLIADRAYISDSSHNYGDLDIPIGLQGDSFIGPVKLSDGCWIGIGAVILPGVTIGRNAVVAANSVVTRSVPDGAVVGGIPAKIIKQVNAGD
jgi:acetyltransferase-like isoleucine patch superfamily enzyme